MTTELAVVNPDQFALTTGNIGKVISDNLQGEQISPADLTRIHVPAGGGTTWEVPTPDGDSESLKAIEAVIVHIARRRAYWPGSTPTGEPPACTSADCVTGKGAPGGPCDECPLNLFKSARKGDGGAGRGKACKESKLLFVLRSGHQLPEVVVAPPGSLKIMRQFQFNMDRPYWTYVTRLELTKVQNKDGIAYAQIKPARVGILSQEQVDGIRAYAQQMEAVFGQVAVDRSDVDDEPTEV